MFLTAQSNGIAIKDSKAKEAVDAAHKALGGADKVNGIKSLVMSGTGTNAVFTLTNQGPMKTTGSITYEFEIRILLPDNIFQVEMVNKGGSLPSSTTYRIVSNGEAFIRTMPELLTSSNVNASKSSNLINRQLQEMARLLIGMLIKAGPMPLTVTSGSTPERFTITTTGGGNETYEVEFDAKGKYPSIVRYKIPSVKMLDREIGIEQNVMMKFRERVVVDGVMFPRVITSKAEAMDREMRIEKIQINPKLTLKDFEIPEQ